MIVRERERTEQRKNTTLRRIVTAARVDETDRIRETISVATLKFCKNKNRGKLHGQGRNAETGPTFKLTAFKTIINYDLQYYTFRKTAQRRVYYLVCIHIWI